MRPFGRLLILAGTCLLSSGMVWGQAPPGPMAPPPASSTTADSIPPTPKRVEVPPRKNILGAWRFNKDESDDPREKLKQARDDRRNGGGGYGGPRVSGPWPGGGPGGGGGSGRRYPQDSDEADRLGDLVNPARELMLVRRTPDDPEVDLTDDRQRRRIFYTDGRQLRKQQDTSYEEIAARWDDDKLVTDEKGPHNGQLSRTLEVSSDGKQLVETVHVTDKKGNHPITVQYVYDAVDPSSLSTSRY
jgi:hypothetical protein